jgi:protein phosphatase
MSRESKPKSIQQNQSVETDGPSAAQLEVPQICLILLVGASGSGKSTFAARHFLATEVVSSDTCRGLVSDDPNDQTISGEAFDLLHTIVAKRLAHGRLTVVDATNVQADSRKPLLALARKYHVIPIAIVFNLDEEVCLRRNALRSDRQFGGQVVRNQLRHLYRSLRDLKREGFRQVHKMATVDHVERFQLIRRPVYNDLRHEVGPFDIIGDVHGCIHELDALLEKLKPWRKLIFLGDLVDRGPDSPAVLRRVMELVKSGQALCVPGNHDTKLMRLMDGRQVQQNHGLAETWRQLQEQTPEFREEVHQFLNSLVSHYVLDNGRLVVAHAGLKQEMQGRTSRTVREFCLYGDTVGETDEFGLPIRYPWATDYRGRALVVYGHTPVTEPLWLNKTVNIDTGCVFGGHLTALRYPELEEVVVAAQETYCEPVRPIQSATSSESEQTATGGSDSVLDLADFLGRLHIQTRYQRNIGVREEQAIASLETMSRFAIDPRWLIYLPPTMSPSETSVQPGYLEHPIEALAGYASLGVQQVICQEKHMGSRAVVVLCRDGSLAKKHFWGADGLGVIYTRTGRSFFDDALVEQGLLQRLSVAIQAAGLWDELAADWLCLDCELMPWSLKADGLIREQYAAVGCSGQAALEQALQVVPEGDLKRQLSQQLENLLAYRKAYRGYCWDTEGLEKIRLAPFHLMASSRGTYFDQTHRWHMELLSRLQIHDSTFQVTRWIEHSLDQAPDAVVDWWLELTAAGGEGCVIKPEYFVSRSPKGLMQPAIKCRGQEYLRIIYGPDYTRDDQLQRLRQRSLATKRSLALREFSLGLEGLHRFVAHESLSRVHECAFGVLALESEPVDPRL